LPWLLMLFARWDDGRSLQPSRTAEERDEITALAR
jgi:hypothetical protein